MISLVRSSNASKKHHMIAKIPLFKCVSRWSFKIIFSIRETLLFCVEGPVPSICMLRVSIVADISSWDVGDGVGSWARKNLNFHFGVGTTFAILYQEATKRFLAL